MRDIKTLLELERNNEPLTVDEKKYLMKYKQTKHFRHSTNFTYHSRKLPTDEEAGK